MKLCVLFLLLFVVGGKIQAEDFPNFVIEGKTFALNQKDVYTAGIYTNELTESEMLQIFRERRFEFSHEFALENKKYTYLLLIVDNRNPFPTQALFRFPSQMQKTKAWLYKDNALLEFAKYPSAFDIFSIELPPGRSMILNMRLSGGDVSGKATSITLHDSNSNSRIVSVEQHVMGCVLGAFAIMILYNLGMFLFFRRIYFLYYIVYSIASLYCLAIFNDYLPLNVPQLGIGLCLTGIGLLLFTESALTLRTTFPSLYRVSLGLIAFSIVFAVLIQIRPDWNLIVLSVPFVLAFCIYASIRRFLDGFRPALYLLIGWFVLLASAIVGFANMALIGSSSLEYTSVFGFTIEICFFSFAIGQKVRLSEQKALRENEHAFNQLKKVFYPHQIEKIKSGIELEQTMPTGKGEAAVICFDIVASSKIQPSYAKYFIESSIKSCVSIISENYDPERLQANGYRIKEMGDGFLCSVGYPFLMPNATHPAQGAVELGFKFIQNFQRQLDEIPDHAAVYCSIGIALDWLEGFFPKVGTVEYDVYGRAVILATRYESLRRQLFPSGVAGHLITLHEKIYAQLPAKLQEGFQEIDLRQTHLVVRDDEDASKVFFRVINSRIQIPNEVKFAPAFDSEHKPIPHRTGARPKDQD